MLFDFARVKVNQLTMAEIVRWVHLAGLDGELLGIFYIMATYTLVHAQQTQYVESMLV